MRAVAWVSIAALVLSLAACGSTGPAETGAASGGGGATAGAGGAAATTSAASTGATTGAGGGALAGCPDEPPGLQKVTERGFDAIDEAGWEHNPTDLFTIEDASTLAPAYATPPGTPPRSPSNVGQALFPAGFVGGGSPLDAWYSEGALADAGYGRMFICFWAQHSSNWVGHDSAVNKIVMLGIGANGNQIIVSATGQGAGPLVAELRLQDLAQSPSEVNLPNDAGPAAVVSRGAWHRYEAYFVANTNGQPNGEAHLWLDGVKITTATGLRYVDGTMGSSFVKLMWTPIWGGVDGEIAEDQALWLDHFYASATP